MLHVNHFKQDVITYSVRTNFPELTCNKCIAILICSNKTRFLQTDNIINGILIIKFNVCQQ